MPAKKKTRTKRTRKKPTTPKSTDKRLTYKDEKGNTLYGFSQVNLEETNRKLNNLVLGVQILIVLFFLFLLGAALFMGWISYNDVITRLIYRG